MFVMKELLFSQTTYTHQDYTLKFTTDVSKGQDVKVWAWVTETQRQQE